MGNGRRTAAGVAAGVLAMAAAAAPAAVSAERLRVEYHDDPLGIDAAAPRLSWVVAESDPAVRGQRQTAYQVRVGTDPAQMDRADLWDTGRVASDRQNQLPYAGRPLASGQHCWWQVRLWDKDGRATGWSRPATWSMGLLTPADWTAQWVDADAAQKAQGPGPYWPAVCLRKGFTARPNVTRATVYATAAGVYEVSLNGRRVGRDFFTPGWTQYDKRLYYQTYDVTDLVHPGAANAVGVTLGDGWYGLHHGGRGRLAARVQLRLEYADGTAQTVGTDPTWRASAGGPIRASDLYNGEAYDARREVPGWDAAGFDDAGWAAVDPFAPRSDPAWKDVTAAVRAAVHGEHLSIDATNEALGGDPFPDRHKRLRVHATVDGRATTVEVREKRPLKLDGPGLTVTGAEYGTTEVTPVADVRGAILEAHPGPPVRQTGELRPVRRTQPKPGDWVYDLGQNFSGLARLAVTAPAGTVVRLRFAEMLNPDGTVYTTNLRAAACTDTYTCRGGGPETYEPHFTFHGFRYVELTGLRGEPGPDAVTGVVLGSDAAFTSTFGCSDPLLNQLQHNIVWGQRSNYLEVPTDCPQRDERRGWAGDAQAFIPTGTYNQDLAAFFTAWLRTYDDVQRSDGAFADYAPEGGNESPGWGDAGVICPWELYQKYGDTRVLEAGYPHMVRWVDYLKAHAKGLVRPKEGYGDWLSLHADTPKDLIATAYFAHVTDLVGRVAEVLGKPDEAARYADLHRQVVAAFQQAFVTADGHVKGETQTGYLLALGFDLLPPDQRAAAADRLRQLIADRHDHLSVGFLGVNLLLPVLTETGQTPLAYKLIENDTYPSWGYPIRQGATTIWERWDGWTADKGFQDAGMNSFNHYAYGSCGQWMFATLAGIAPATPGFGHVTLHPRPGGGLTEAHATYDSVRGPVSVHWAVAAPRVSLDVVVPPNVTATVYVPTGDPAGVTEGTTPADHAPGVTPGRPEPGFAVYEVGGGHYAFAADLPGGR